MQKIRYGLLVLSMLLCLVTSAAAQVSIGIGLPNVSIGINLPLFPELVPVPGYPVYYAPQMDANYFFYDGMYWVYQEDNWYASSWYNGPWGFVEPTVVPLYILRVPVSYYRQPPVYFRGWHSDAPPRWGQHWGHDWEQHRRGWDRWNRGSAPARAPLPVYQRKYSGDRYPHQVEQQQRLRNERYRYQPRDRAVRQHFQRQVGQGEHEPAQRGRQEEPSMRSPRQQDNQRSTPPQHGGPDGQRSQPQQRGDEKNQRSAPDRNPPQQRGSAPQDRRQQPGAAEREQQAPRPQMQEQRSQGQEQRSQDRGASQESNRDRGQGQNRDEERGRGRDK